MNPNNKPLRHLRKTDGTYCCVQCDGLFSTWKRRKAMKNGKHVYLVDFNYMNADGTARK